ncbi:MAG: hypothetical protein H5T86_13880 [Armatimonadetes bacterium]|nr:hypothetical protein [Armatimonadota bacterium]
MVVVAALLMMAAAGQTIGREALVGWGVSAGWWDCGDLGGTPAAVVSYHWPQWLVQIGYGEPDGVVAGSVVNGEVWAIEGFRLWRSAGAEVKRSWFAGAGAGYYDVGIDGRSAGGGWHDTDTAFGGAIIVGLGWPSGWTAQVEYVVAGGIDVRPSGSSAPKRIDIDGLRVHVGKRF